MAKDINQSRPSYMQLTNNYIPSRRCNASSKRTKLQCGAPAMRGKSKCRFHGGKSTGFRTEEGKQRIIAANTKHGNYTKAKLQEHREKSTELFQIEDALHVMDMATAPRTRGRKPSGYKPLKNTHDVELWMKDKKLI